MRIVKLVATVFIAMLVFFIGFAFIEHNKQPVALDLLLIQLEAQFLALWLILFFLLGGLFGLLASSLLIAKEKNLRYRVEKRLKTTSKLITG